MTNRGVAAASPLAVMFHQCVVRVEISCGPGIGQLPRQHAPRGSDRGVRRHDAEAPRDAQVVGIDDQRPHLKPAEVQDGGAHLGAHPGKVLKPGQGIVDRPLFQEIQIQTAAPGMDLAECRRQVYRLPVGEGERREMGQELFRRRVSDRVPTSEPLDHRFEHPLRDLGLGPRAQKRQNQLTERRRPQPRRRRSVVIDQLAMDGDDTCRCERRKRVLHDSIFEQNRNISSGNRRRFKEICV